MSIVRIGAGSSELAPAEEIGAKAAILARVASAGVTVPPAFVLPISLGAAIAAGDHDAKRALKDRLKEGMAFLEDATGLRFGDRREPLLVSVRSGAARSMPGMLDSLLDVGCTTEATRGLIRMTGNPRFAWDCRRRFLECWAETVLGLDRASLAAKRDALILGEGARRIGTSTARRWSGWRLPTKRWSLPQIRRSLTTRCISSSWRRAPSMTHG